mgnify:CR=1 FL=1
MSSLQILISLMAILQVSFEFFLRRKNEASISRMQKNPPSGASAIMDKETWAKTSEYTLAKSKLSTIEDFLGLLFFLPTFLFLFPWVFSLWPTGQESGIWGASFVACAFLNLIQLPNLFFDWYKQFILEEKFGFNQSTLHLWAVDKVKGTMIGFFVSFIFIACLIFLYREISFYQPAYWWVFVFCVFFGIQLLAMILWPKFILPLFNKFSPLEEGELKERLIGLAERTGFKAKTIEVVDGSKRSRHSNAYFTGFGRFRKIVLYDTLIEQMEAEEVEAVLAHEVGHYRMGHIPKRLATSFFFGLASFGFLSLCLSSPWIYESLNLSSTLTNSLSSMLVALILSIGFFTYWISPVSNFFSRKHEYEADRFASQSMGGPLPLINALRKLYVENLSHPFPHPWIANFHNSHPTILEREESLVKKPI